MKKMWDYIEDNWECFIVLLGFILFLILLVCFGINASTEEITIVKDPAWLEWERAYGRQGF